MPGSNDKGIKHERWTKPLGKQPTSTASSFLVPHNFWGGIDKCLNLELVITKLKPPVRN